MAGALPATHAAPRAARGRRAPGPGRTPEPLQWLAPLLAIATLFFLWPVVNVIRLAFADTTLLRDDYSYRRLLGGSES